MTIVYIVQRNISSNNSNNSSMDIPLLRRGENLERMTKVRNIDIVVRSDDHKIKKTNKKMNKCL